MTGETGAAPATGARLKPAWLAALGLLILLLVSLAARLWYSSVSPLSYDETHNLMIGMLANQGHAPYREIYSVIMPFSILTMRASAALWGATHHVRTLMMLFGLMGVAALYFLVYRQARSLPAWAALFAGAFFSFNPHYFFVSTSINLEAAALAWGLLTVALAEVYRIRRGDSWRALWLVLAGVAFGLSITVKIFVPFVPAVVATQLLIMLTADEGRGLLLFDTWWRLIKLGLLCVLGMALAVVFFLLFFDRSALMEQVLASRFALREAIESDADVNIAEALDPSDLWQYAPLLAGAAVGVYVAWRQRLVHAWIWLVWFALACAFLLTHDPVRPRHTVMVLPALAAFSGIGLAWLLATLAARNASLARWLSPALASAVLILTVLAPLPLVETESFTERHPVRQAAIDFVQQTTAPGDCLISKENRLHFLSGRLSTPKLSLISTARLFSGLLPAADIAADADVNDCPVLVYADTFDRLVPDLRTELDDVYSVRLTLVDPQEPDYPLDVYAVQMDDGRSPDHAADLLFGDQIAFTGYSLTPTPWQPGNPVNLTTFWQAQSPVAADYKLFVHVLDAQGNVVAQYDHYPFALDPSYPVTDIALNPAYGVDTVQLPDAYPATGMIPTSRWLPGRALVETAALRLPEDMPPGDYALTFGLYDEATLQRLPLSGLEVESGRAESDRVLLDTVRVE